ncbi:hypothetical protein SCLCIDRAFT_22915 [Scleroderma citrinum Foug A]|uniref:Uncharacterized protein n=1 Tax=Scleroderma citrinum Foug A TaxID=1036808 RepID=A0A0C3EAZ6_9AGAM|nr:hypothetical protein SCLCIDRAFT_22915 [Scleroderma citrinum Foug A]
MYLRLLCSASCYSGKVVRLFRRIIRCANHQTKYAHWLSNSLEVGSSFAPDLEDASARESEPGASSPHSLISHTHPNAYFNTSILNLALCNQLHLHLPAFRYRMWHPLDCKAYAEQYAIFVDFAASDIDRNAEEFVVESS